MAVSGVVVVVTRLAVSGVMAVMGAAVEVTVSVWVMTVGVLCMIGVAFMVDTVASEEVVSSVKE